ncbi:MAG: DUF167 domain-containing protein [Candidatus Eremiobacteraeota bacterium]|nr:DUF167 domain-containing protein [Candidatus Eremiobacteraeota bacterium]
MSKKRNSGERPLTENRIHIAVKVHPRSARDEIAAFKDGVIHVKLRALPQEGRANEALIEYLASFLGIRKSDISLVRGARAKDKLLAITGVAMDTLIRKVTAVKGQE